MVFERASVFPTPEEHISRLPAAALGVRLLEARRRGLLPRRARPVRPAATRSAGRSTPTGPASCPTDEPGIAHAVPDLIRKVLERSAAASDLRLRRADADAHPRRRHRRRASSRRCARPPALNEDFNISAVAGADRRRDRAHRLGGVRRGPGRSSRWSTCRASRSTSSAAGPRSRRPGGCSAGRPRSTSSDGIAATVRVAARTAR